jgi:xanthine dehydrogenase accessory factor
MAAQPDGIASPLILVKSASDIGSAVAHALKRAGGHPVLLEGTDPGVTRRRMAFAPAVHEGQAELEGLMGVRFLDAKEALAARLRLGVVPVLVTDVVDPAPELKPDIVVDARMRKRREPPVQLNEAPLTLGIGPGFVCRVHAHGVIESNWGPGLGRVIWEGASEAYTGKHREVGGFGYERYVYAPQAGHFRTGHGVLDRVQAGDTIGWVDEVALKAEIGGVLRGLAFDGLTVAAGAKLIEVDPTDDPARSIGIGERQRAIAAGVLKALYEKRIFAA